MNKLRRKAPLPALLLMGPPHSGKSVLAYHLARTLRERGIAHFLLRTAPDGEGNWFYEGPPKAVIPLRLTAKGNYTPQLVQRMLDIIRRRHLPLLVDMGGKPRGTQWDVLRACTHGVLLYRTVEERDAWLTRIRQAGLPLVAVLQSHLFGPDRILRASPCLEGVISGLDRRRPQLGETFEALVRRVVALFRAREADLEAFHARTAPRGFTFLSERALAQALGKPLPPWWEPEDIPRLLPYLPQDPVALYGRGPTWLAAAVAAHLAPRPMTIFDAHFGWVRVPDLTPDARAPLALEVVEAHGAVWLKMQPRAFLFPQDLPRPSLPSEASTVILWGKLPRWVYAAYARALAPQVPRLAVWEPRRERAVYLGRQRREA